MDYDKIYRAFIEDRKHREAGLTGYVERHHILPRSLGGGDEPENLIALTAEDHFFAHLLLAKIHGGKLWAPIAFMIGGQKRDWRPRRSRREYGWAAREMAKNMSGAGAYQFDHTVHEFQHRDGRLWSGLQSDMPDQLGVSASLANMLIKGRIKSARGWAKLGVRGGRLAGVSHPMHRKEAHHFVHMDGREFVGTQFAFHLAMGVSKPTACKLARGTAIVWNGWHLKGAVLPTTGRGSRWQRGERRTGASGTEHSVV